MKDFFSYDGIVFKICDAIGDVFILSILWTITSIPIVTMGTSTASCYYIFTKKAMDKDVSIFSDYFTQFRNNLKQTLVLNIIFTLVWAIVLVGIFILRISGFYNNSFLSYVVICLQIIYMSQLFIVTLYLYPLISRFENSNINSVKMAFIVGNKYIFSTIALIALLFLIIFLTYYIPILIVVSVGVYFMLSSYIFVRVLKKINPDVDK
ncbi:MAG: YesL family protein [Lachnospirales bacterium]